MAILSMSNGIKASGLNFQLPDGETNVSIRAANDTDPDNEFQSYHVYAQGEHISTWIADRSTTTRISPAMVLDERAEEDCIRQLKLVSTAANGTNGVSGEIHEHSEAAMIERTWISIYALWLKLQDQDVFAIAVPAEARYTEYLIAIGLGVPSPFEQGSAQAGGDSRILLLAREPFWQGAGAPDRFAWLRARPEASFPGINGHLGAFASQMSFTRKGNVCTTHPLRPPKPAPGTVLYSRYIVELGQHLKLVHIDAQNPLHFDNYCKWQNSDRVNHGWRERGPDDKHRAYLESQRLDPHTMSLIFLWDDEPAGYSEVGWAKEDNTACFVNSNCNIHIGEFDQNSHMLVGEERFRGGKRYQAVATSIKHLCFLRDPRTQQVIAEPRHDLPSVPIQARFLPQERKKRFQLPHKTAVLFALQRDRFFSEGHFY